jgi:hypothetical protein
MSNSYSCVKNLRELAEELHSKAYELEHCADTLDILRDADCYTDKIKEAKKWAKEWMK